MHSIARDCSYKNLFQTFQFLLQMSFWTPHFSYTSASVESVVIRVTCGVCDTCIFQHRVRLQPTVQCSSASKPQDNSQPAMQDSLKLYLE